MLELGVELHVAHRAPVLDVAWRDDAVFASCSTDRAVLACAVGEKALPQLYEDGKKSAAYNMEIKGYKVSPNQLACQQDIMPFR